MSIFFGKTNLKLIEKQESLKGVREHAPSENFWKFTCSNGYFSAFWIIFRQILFKLFDPNLSASQNMMHFVRTFSIMRAQGVRLIANEEVRNYGKIVYIQNNFENGWYKMHTPHPTPLDPPLAISYRNHQKSMAYFSYLAQLILFLFTKRQSQKGEGHGPMPP